MNLQRQTFLTLKQLEDIVKGRVPAPDCDNCSGYHPGCAKGFVSTGHAAEEIGIIFLQENNKAAEEILTGMMHLNSPMALTGHFFLSQRRSTLPPETEKLLKAYEDDSKNAEGLERIKNRIAEMNARR